MSNSIASVNNIMDKWGKDMLQQPNITYDTARGQQLLDQSTTFYKKHCFYCHKTFQTNRTAFVDHLFQHGFQLGRPNKLVYIERFVNIIEDLFESYKCLFCFNKFTTKLDMIRHMNEYGHNRIDPENNFFDQFYIVNYMKLKEENNAEIYKNDDLTGNLDVPITQFQITCPFCDHVSRCFKGYKLHLYVFHKFELEKDISPLQLLH